MNRTQILGLIGDGRFCSVTFFKANGDKRVMNCRTGVKKGLRGGDKPFSDEEKGLITVWEPKIKDYRSFKADRVVTIKAKGKVWTNDTTNQ